MPSDKQKQKPPKDVLDPWFDHRSPAAQRDDHHSMAHTHAGDGSGDIDHDDLINVTANQHHAENHDHDGSPTQKLLQANTHESADTDVATSSLHHTIGGSATQAAAGNHAHSGMVTGAGTATQVAYFSSASVITSHSGLTYNSATSSLTVGGTLTVGASVVTGTSGNLTVNVTATKTLTLSASDNFTVTIPATGTAALGTGAVTCIAYWSGTNTLTADGALKFISTDTLLVGGATFRGVSGGINVSVTSTKILTLASADDYTLTVPATGTAALLATANIFTAAQLVQMTGANLFIVDTTDSTTASQSSVQARSLTSTIFMASHDSARTVTRYGLTLGGYTEITSQNNGGTNNGLIIGTQGAVPIVFGTNNAEAMRLTSSKNLGLGTATFGTSANTVLAIFNGTAPSSGPADTVQFYSSDDSAGNTVPSFYCEGTGVVATGQADSASSVRVKMRINGTVRTFLCI